jgi:stage II sporulation protein E
MNSTENSLLQLTECALSSGKATILDINGNLTVNCDRVGLVLSSINSQSEGLMSHITRAKEADNNRLLIGEQLGGVSKIMQQLALDCKGKMSFNNLKEKDIADKLTFHNVLCSEAVFIEQNSGVLVILTVAARDLDSAVIASVVSEAVKLSMKIDKVEPCESPNWMTVYMSNEARFKLSYGIRNYTKANSTVSGDTHSFNNLENNRFMLAICDGMGSGTQAENMSTTAITLVENFYRAGFDSDVILTCTNKLLSGFDSEVFTAVDIAVVDLNNGLCDFIKLGAPDGLVKINGEVQYVSGSSLPLGVLDEMKPSVTKTILKSGDFVVLASDGFWESFKTTDTVADFLHNNVATNPQVVADDLMERALSNCKHTPKDDMTLIVARLV